MCGIVVGDLYLERGLRQGDPLSQILFLIVAESLATLLHKVKQDKALKWIAVAKRAPAISHLIFVDDS